MILIGPQNVCVFVMVFQMQSLTWNTRKTVYKKRQHVIVVTFIRVLLVCRKIHTQTILYNQRRQLITVFSSLLHNARFRNIPCYYDSAFIWRPDCEPSTCTHKFSWFRTQSGLAYSRLLVSHFFLLCSCNFWLEAHASVIPALNCLILCLNQRITQTYFDCYWNHKTSAHAITAHTLSLCMLSMFHFFFIWCCCCCRNFSTLIRVNCGK